ncbi:hypothetical protein EUX98_g3147 [Antrodiella citrinella]|uniref:Uncharacterized protein n=1 Tax=Antrodiella citrinella TaxID=2447956 RepID=A0A4S4MYI8_9APHY|nr:hypothetical protein EUX98_g3147 [Antrodiella citrinella]
MTLQTHQMYPSFSSSKAELVNQLFEHRQFIERNVGRDRGLRHGILEKTIVKKPIIRPNHNTGMIISQACNKNFRPNKPRTREDAEIDEALKTIFQQWIDNGWVDTVPTPSDQNGMIVYAYVGVVILTAPFPAPDVSIDEVMLMVSDPTPSKGSATPTCNSNNIVPMHSPSHPFNALQQAPLSAPLASPLNGYNNTTIRDYYSPAGMAELLDQQRAAIELGFIKRPHPTRDHVAAVVYRGAQAGVDYQSVKVCHEKENKALARVFARDDSEKLVRVGKLPKLAKALKRTGAFCIRP